MKWPLVLTLRVAEGLLTHCRSPGILCSGGIVDTLCEQGRVSGTRISMDLPSSLTPSTVTGNFSYKIK